MENNVFELFFFLQDTNTKDARILPDLLNEYDYKLHFEVDDFGECIIQIHRNEFFFGAQFEKIMKKADFSDEDTLFIIQSKPDRLNTTVRSSSNKEYRYIRYVGPPGGLCNVAEVAFYEKNDTLPLSGKIIGTPGCYQHDGTHEYTNVFDGKTYSEHPEITVNFFCLIITLSIFAEY